MEWSKTHKDFLLAFFYIGYVLTQFGGRVAELIGGKWIFGIGILITSICTLFTPMAAKSLELLVFLRFMAGMGQGVTLPVMHAMLAQWAPLLERSKLSTFIYAGVTWGIVATYPLTGKEFCKAFCFAYTEGLLAMSL